jgi:hypothetical protein
MAVLDSQTIPQIRALDLTAAGAERLKTYAAGRHREYVENAPFPHIVIDDLIPTDVLDSVLGELNGIEYDGRKDFYGSVDKYYTNDLAKLGPHTQRLLTDLNSRVFLEFLETLTGVTGLVADPLFQGGGYHETRRGGFLKMHADFNWHQKLHLDRRLNLLLYLNKDWDDAWAGHLEIADPDFKTTKQVAPLFNRIVVFSTTDFSFHGHPDPLACPPDRARQSLALYYYTNGRPRSEVARGHSVNTDYRPRPGEEFTGEPTPGLLGRIRRRLTAR